MGFLGRQPGIALFTVVEAAGLVAWLALATGAVTVDVVVSGVAVPPAALGVGVLFVGLVVEHALTDLTVNGLRLRNLSPSTFAVATTETALWIAWLLVADAVGGLAGVAAAGVVLAILLVPQHTIEDIVLRGRESLARGLGYWTVPVSVVEALGATVLLALVIEPALLGTVGSATDLGLLEAVRSSVDLARIEAVAPATDVDAVLAGVGALVAFLFVEHNLAVLFTLRTADQPADRPEAAVAQ